MHPRDVADDHLRPEGPVGDDVRDALLPVLAPDVVDDLAAAPHAEVDVEVGRGDALRVEEALEEQPEADRVEVRDPQQVGDEAAGAGAAAGTHGDALALRPRDEIPDHQEIVDEPGDADDRQLELEPHHQLLVAGEAGVVGRLRFLARRRVTDALQPFRDRRLRGDGRRIKAVTGPQALEAELVEVACPVGLHLRWQRVAGVALAALGEGDREVAHLRYEAGVGHRVGHFREEPCHLRARLQVELLPGEAHPLLLLDLGAGLDAEHRVVRARVGLPHVVHVVRADHLQVEVRRELQEPGNDLPLLGEAVVLQLHEEILAAEDLHEPTARAARLLLAAVQEVLWH